MFDLDGTLLDTIGDISDSMNSLMIKYGLPEKSEKEYAAMVGYGAPQFIRDNFPDNFDHSTILAEYRITLSQNSRNRTGLFEGIGEMLTFLTEKSLPLAVLTNKPEQTAREVCAYFLSSWPFTHISGQLDGVPHKPHPGQALEIISDWGIEPSECLYMGDTSTDMETAKNAGFIAVGCSWGFRSREELEKTGAEEIVDCPDELIQLIESWC